MWQVLYSFGFLAHELTPAHFHMHHARTTTPPASCSQINCDSSHGDREVYHSGNCAGAADGKSVGELVKPDWGDSTEKSEDFDVGETKNDAGSQVIVEKSQATEDTDVVMVKKMLVNIMGRFEQLGPNLQDRQDHLRLRPGPTHSLESHSFAVSCYSSDINDTKG